MLCSIRAVTAVFAKTRFFTPTLTSLSAESNRFFAKKAADNYKEIVLNEADIEESFVKGGGPGGQSVNKSANCVQLKHGPTGIVVKAHESRSLFVNRKKARKKLRLQLDFHFNGPKSQLAQEEASSVKRKRERKRRARRRLLLKRAFKSEVVTSFNGVVVALDKTELFDGSDFESILANSLSEWKQEGRRGVWLNIPIKNAHLIPIAASHGFVFHHTKPAYCVMTTWLEDSPNSIPEYCGNNIGVGGFVVDEASNEVLCIRENRGPYLGWKFPGGSVDDGESLQEACVREVREETGVDVEFIGILLFRHVYPFRYDNGDTYYLCLCRALTKEAQPDGQEIAEVSWKNLSEMKAIAHETKISPFVREIVAAYEQYQQTGRIIVGERPEFSPNSKIYTMFRMTDAGRPASPLCSNCGKDFTSSIH